MSGRLPKCPTCRAPAPPRARNPAFPFCSLRCKQVDLGKWLGEEFRIAERAADEREDEMEIPERGPQDA